MISLEIFYGVPGKVRVSGHSPKQMGKRGENLLCAGVSVLAQSVFLYLWKEGRVRGYHKEDGLLEFEITELSHTVRVALEVLIVGFQDLQYQYPDLISMKIGGENGA